MDLPDCPPGAEGYQDSVVEVPKKPDINDTTSTKAEQEFLDHLNSLKIRLENGEYRCMVERRGRDISGKWIYLCYPCGSVCSGESILQTHISGKKHKVKLSMKSSWPMTIFEEHPFYQNQKGNGPAVSTATEKVLQKMAAEVEIHKQDPSDLDVRYNKYREPTCHIQDALDALKAPLVGAEYLVEHPPELAHYEPTYLCTLCTKQGHPRTIVNHLTCFWHRYNYILRHFPKACQKLAPYKAWSKYREGVNVVMFRLAQRIDDKYGRMRPVNIEKDIYEKEKDQINQWLFKGPHFSEKMGPTFEEVVDEGLIESLAKQETDDVLRQKSGPAPKKRDPSPPYVAAPSRSKPNYRGGRRERRSSLDSLSDISDEDTKHSSTRPVPPAQRAYNRDRVEADSEKYAEQRRQIDTFRAKYVREVKEKEEKHVPKSREPYKVKLAEEKRQAVVEAAASRLAYHEKNPEKHPLYPEEWKKFWNRRYKEIQAEGKDPAKHDFKPEWILFWTKRMKELHQEEVETQVSEIYRRMNLPIPDFKREEKRQLSAERRRSPDRRRSPERRRSPVWGSRNRSPDSRRRSPDDRRRSPDYRHRSSPRRHEVRPAKRTYPESRYSAERRRQAGDTRPSPPKRNRSRSPSVRVVIDLEESRSGSPLSQRESVLRNRSPLSRRAAPLRNQSPAHDVAPSMQTVMISDDELKPDDGLSPWNSDNEVESVSSVSRSARAASHASSRRTRTELPDLGPPENIVATLRVLVALEDYLGSLGPKIVDLLTEALKMEKERANSSEELLERESAVVLVETAKEKLKGAAQAGLVPAAAAPALRAAILRAAATLHEADTRARKKQQETKPPASESSSRGASAVPVAGVGAVDRAQIAQQMAAALIAQGKTDVSSEELAQLVDAVVGMAEAKKREAEAARPPPAKLCGTATALQMLQSAYEENDKKTEKEDATYAMDGLSDSDLETLLKNFNELSAEEQHSLIAYLKKLEAREPQRVERLRQYVSAAATAPAPAPAPAAASAPAPVVSAAPDVKPVVIDSDEDDDYTVEEVFHSAKQKVKEDQIRKELDVVKKSLEESKEEVAQPKAAAPAALAGLVRQMSSASDLFALVQASIQSTSAATAAPGHNVNLIATATNLRSFGDAADHAGEPAPQLSPPVPPMPREHVENTQNANYEDEAFEHQQLMQWGQEQMNDAIDDGRPMSGDFDRAGSRLNQFAATPDQYNMQALQFGPSVGFDQTANQFGQGHNNFGQTSGPYQYGQELGTNQFNQGNQYPPQNQFVQRQNQNNWQGNAAPWQSNRYQGNHFGGNINGGMGEHFESRQHYDDTNQQQFHKNNFRGRGRGGRGRGRGRGRF